jgi:sugar phosphate isomerase/epimerase
MTGLAISNIAWPAECDGEALGLARANGFSAIELAPSKTFGAWEAIELSAVRAAAAGLAARGLPVVALQAILFGVPGARLFGTAEERAAIARHLRFVARLAGACGGVPCVFGAPAARDPGHLSNTEAMDQAAAFFAGIAPAFATEGASLAFEANPTAYGCRFVTHTREAIALVRRVAAPGFGLQIDTGTMMMNAEDPALLAEAAPFAVHCHASAPRLDSVGPHAATHAKLAAALRGAGWQRIVSVEMRAAEDWRAALQEAGVAMGAVWA